MAVIKPAVTMAMVTQQVPDIQAGPRLRHWKANTPPFTCLTEILSHKKRLKETWNYLFATSIAYSRCLSSLGISSESEEPQHMCRNPRLGPEEEI